MASANPPTLVSASSSHRPASSVLLHLPAALLSQVCNYLPPRELLVTFARASKHVRALLTSDCFNFPSSEPVVLRSRELLLLSSLPLSSCLNQSPFYSRHFPVVVRVAAGDSMRRVLDSLDFFPGCRSLFVRAAGRHIVELSDADLYDLLHHPTTVACHDICVLGFDRAATKVRVESDQSTVDLRTARSRRRGSLLGFFTNLRSRRQPFDWANIRLPALTILRLLISSLSRYVGGAAFLTAHTGLRSLTINISLLMSVDELTAIFQDTAALPALMHLGLYDSMAEHPYNLAPLITALATVVVRDTGRPRAVEALLLGVPASPELFSAAALIPGLTSLRVSLVRAGWLRAWTKTPLLTTAWPLLKELDVDVWNTLMDEESPASDILPLVQSLCPASLEILHINPGERVRFDAAALSLLTSLHRLKTLEVTTFRGMANCIEWVDSALVTSFTAGCLSELRSLILPKVRLSAESVVAIASAAPELRKFKVFTDPTCHPAVMCAIVGGYCQHIEDLAILEEGIRVWSNVQATEVTAAYQSAIAAAGRGGGYRPFTQLHSFRVEMCWCTSASVWHALLSLLRWASHLQCVSRMNSNDPLVVTALTHLPSLNELGAACAWPRSFSACICQKHVRTGGYAYLACDDRVETEAIVAFSGMSKALHLTVSGKEGGAIPLRPGSRLLTAYCLSLPAEHQAVLRRWARDEFHADDHRLTAAEGGMVAYSHCHCTATVYSCYRTREELVPQISHY